VTNRELYFLLETLNPEADVLIVDPHHDYEAEPYGPYHDLTERMDNEGEFAVRARTVEGRSLIEIGSVSHVL
jgi:hypothetical protein